MARVRKRKRLSGGDRRAQLIEVGRRVFALRGYDAASMEEIATRAKVTRPIVYTHFGDKEGVFKAVVEIETAELERRIVDAVSSGPPRQRLERAALSFLSYVRDRPDGFRILSDERAPAVAGDRAAQQLVDAVAERVARVIGVEFEQQGFDPATAPIYAYGVTGLMIYVARWWSTVREPPVEAVAAHVAALCWNGFANLPRRPAVGGDAEKKKGTTDEHR